ncbi:hypothetical protein PQR15_26225 [Streptomyces lydicus]|nr:hypothetical protein [Streptomyces lydicus]
MQLGAYATARLPAGRRTELLRAHSTNVANLRAGRWATLLTSAAFVERPLTVPYGAALLAALGSAEARWGAPARPGCSRPATPAPACWCTRACAAGCARPRRTPPPGPSMSGPATASTPHSAPSP